MTGGDLTISNSEMSNLIACYIGATFLKSDLSTAKIPMRHPFAILTFIAAVILPVSCKKHNTSDCSPSVATVRQITDKPAVVKVTATVYSVYLVEQGAIDIKLIPCNLPKDFMQHDLQVIVSGDVKVTPQGSGPCCSANFVITKITR